MNSTELTDRIHACWLGKAIGGTLGMPFEGNPGYLNLSYYDPVPGAAVANDDLDLQLLWLMLLEQHGAKLSLQHLGQAWLEHQLFEMDEYGIARWNLKRGMQPPVTGVHNNWFRDGMGAAIRSEIWACLFPGKPAWSAHFATMDACVDHAGEGVYAEVFLSAMQSAAFLTRDPIQAIREGLKFVPGTSRLSQAVQHVLELSNQALDSSVVRDRIMLRWGSGNFTDCVMNVAFIAMGLVLGRGDFEKSMLLAVNCGQDTDCTGATTAATLGILHGTASLPERWRQPIGEGIVVSGHLKGLPLPRTMAELTQRTLAVSATLQRDLGANLPTPIALHETSPVRDDNQWFVQSVKDLDFDSEPAEVLLAETQPGKVAKHRVSFPGIHLDLSPHCVSGTGAIYLVTHVRVPEDLPGGQLMLCADTGITAWLDGQMILNYHGRHRMVPAFHRTEGGATIPVHLRAGKNHLLKIRLIFTRPPLGFCAAVGDARGGHVVGAKFVFPD